MTAQSEIVFHNRLCKVHCTVHCIRTQKYKDKICWIGNNITYDCLLFDKQSSYNYRRQHKYHSKEHSAQI